MKILVTGGCGYVGSMLVPSLLNKGHEVVVADAMWFGNYLEKHPKLTVNRADIRDPDAIPMEGVDVVVHLANVANDPCAELDSKLSWEVNALAIMRLAERAIKHGAKQFIFSSSGSVYGVKDEPEVTEELELVPISDYNKTKMIAERVLLSYADRIAVQCVRPATVCGLSPRMRLDVAVNLLTAQAATKGEITVLGGDQTRPNIHIRDLVRVFEHFINLGDKEQGVFNAGFENLTILQIAETVSKHVPAKITVAPSNDPRSYRLCSRKLEATGFTPEYRVEDAIREIAGAFASGVLKDEDRWNNIRSMKKIPGLCE